MSLESLVKLGFFLCRRTPLLLASLGWQEWISAQVRFHRNPLSYLFLAKLGIRTENMCALSSTAMSSLDPYFRNLRTLEPVLKRITFLLQGV